MRKKLIISALFLVLTASATAQDLKSGDFFIEGGLRYGFVLHHPDRDYLKDLWNNSYEVRFGLQTHGENSWERPLGNPILGVALRLTDYTDWFDNSTLRQQQQNILGKNIALFGYIHAPIIRLGWFSWNYQFGFGMAYFTKIYDIQTNPQNELISTRITPYVNFQTGFDFRLNGRLDLSLNLNGVHSSNASLNMPNWGINEITGIVSLRYHLNRSLPKIKPAEETGLGLRNAMFVSVDPGWLWARYNNYYYFKIGLSGGYERTLSPIFRVGSEFELHFTKSVAPTRDYLAETTHNEVPSFMFSSAIAAFGDITFGRFIIHIGTGLYLYRNPDKFDLAEEGSYSSTLHNPPIIYEKVGFRVELGKNRDHFIGLLIRAHFPVADYLAITYGFKLWRF